MHKNSITKKILKKILNTYTYKTIGEIYGILKKRNLYKKVILTNQEKKETKQFYQEFYKKNIPLFWHRLYKGYTGKYDKKYFPEILFSTKLELILNDEKKCKVFEDKSLIEILFSKVENLYFPKTYVMCCHRIWYNEKREIISYQKALEIIENVGKCICKKTIDTSSGRDVKLYNIKNGIDIDTKVNSKQIIKEFKDNFIVQECLTNCKEIANIYDKSINTFRVITYTINGKIYHTPSTMRIGRDGNFVDNAHAGGIFIGINDNGCLQDIAFTEYQEKFKKHPNTGVKFSGIKISKFPEVLKIAHKCHNYMPYAGIISWDFAIDNKNQIVLIEANLFGQGTWLPQIANGESLFGDNTEYMLNLIKKT